VVADVRRRGVDRVACGGDLALTGPRPAEVIDRVRELGWPGAVGNTDPGSSPSFVGNLHPTAGPE